MIVLIADKFEESGQAGLRAQGCEVLYEPDLTDQALADRIGASKADVLVVRSTKVTEPMFTGGLKLVVRAGSGYNTIDLKAAAARGVRVANCPGQNSIAVAELAFALMLALDRRLPENVADLRAGTWNKKEYSKARGLYGRTLGLLGAGSIGREMIRRAGAFGMPVVVWSRRFHGADRRMAAAETEMLGLDNVRHEIDIQLAPSPADVAARADVLSIHLALAPETRGIVNAEVLGRLKPGSVVINTARAEVLDQDALRAAIRDRKLRVGLDVFAGEPATAAGTFADPIVQEPAVYGTHHIGASTDQAQEAIAAETVRVVKHFKDSGDVVNEVIAAR